MAIDFEHLEMIAYVLRSPSSREDIRGWKVC